MRNDHAQQTKDGILRITLEYYGDRARKHGLCELLSMGRLGGSWEHDSRRRLRTGKDGKDPKETFDVYNSPMLVIH